MPRRVLSDGEPKCECCGKYLASTTIGGAIVGTASTVSGAFAATSLGTAIASSSATLAISALAIATSAVGSAVIAVGAVFKIGKKLFGR